ncbi:MAG: porin family protein [Alphaproteobacteria bacterium]|nr:porin family protein [Alphaproteobacteria bacterium]
MRRMILGAVVGMLGLSMSADAGDRTWYVAIEAGVESDGGQGSFWPNEYNSGLALLATVGTRISNQVRLEGELGYRSNDVDSYSSSIDVNQYSLMANAVYEIPVSKELSFDIGMGLGLDHIELDSAFFSVSDTELAGQLKFGLSLAVSDATDLTLNYRYLRSFGGDFYLAGGDSGVRDSTWTVGLRFDL